MDLYRNDHRRARCHVQNQPAMTYPDALKRAFSVATLVLSLCFTGADLPSRDGLAGNLPAAPDNDCTRLATGPGPTGSVCPTGTLRVCVDKCLPVVGLRGVCTNDLCSGTGSVCDVGLTCVAGGPPLANRCVVAAPVGAACSLARTAVENRCPAGTYCRDVATCAGNAGLSLPGAQPACSHFVTEGSRCDGDFAAAEGAAATSLSGGPICDACEPGTTCAPLAGTGVNTCQRACDPANPGNSCPCTGVSLLRAATASSPAHCAQCLDDNVACGKACVRVLRPHRQSVRPVGRGADK